MRNLRAVGEVHGISPDVVTERPYVWFLFWMHYLRVEDNERRRNEFRKRNR